MERSVREKLSGAECPLLQPVGDTACEVLLQPTDSTHQELVEAGEEKVRGSG